MKDITDIVKRNINLVPYFINSIGLARRYDDFVDTGWIGLCYGAQTYDESKGKESTYLGLCIKQSLIKQIAYEHCKVRYKDYNHHEMLSLDKEYCIDSDEACTLSDLIPSDFDIDDELIKMAYENAVEDVLKQIDAKVYSYNKVEKHSDVIRDYFGIGVPKMRKIDIADKYNVSLTTVGAITKKFKSKMQDILSFYINNE